MLGKQKPTAAIMSTNKARTNIPSTSGPSKFVRQTSVGSPGTADAYIAIPQIKTIDNAKLLPKYTAGRNVVCISRTLI